MAIEHEIFSEVAKNLSIEVMNGTVYAMDASIEKGKAARVISDGRLGFAFSTSPGTTDEDLIGMAVSVAGSVEPDPDLVFPGPERSDAIGPDHKGITGATVEEKIDMVKELEAAARRFDSRIKAVRQPSYEESIKEVAVRNSRGVDVVYTTALSVFRVTAIAEGEKGSEKAAEMELTLDPKKINPAIIGKKAAERAIAFLTSRRIGSRRCRALFDRFVVSQMLSLIAPSFFADSVFKNRSRFAGRLGDRIYSPSLSIINDPTLISGFVSSPYDAEGAACRRTAVVRGGILQNFLSDAYYSRKTGYPPTASSVRSEPRQMPKIGVQNFYIEPGRKGTGQLKKEMREGLYITDVMGLHTVNQVTGDFSVGAEGFWIDDGLEHHGVKGITIAGNLHDMLKRVTGVGNDLKFYGSTGGVSLLIEEIAVSGG